MNKILFYYPSNKSSVVIQTTLKELSAKGHEILFLTTCERGVLHDKLEELGIKTFTNSISSSNSLTHYVKQISFLIRFCKQHKVDIIFSNLQHVNFIAVLAQRFVKARVIAFRHHFKYNKGDFGVPLNVNKNEVLFDKVINRLAKEIVVPSIGVYNGIKNYEKVDLSKIKIIPYLYDFSSYGTPNLQKVEAIKNKFPADLRIIMVARLIPFKRHILLFPLYKKLIREGFNIQVVVLDEGPEKDNLQAYINEHNLQDHIHLIGFTTSFLEYMAACDLLIHPSITEASNNVVKEIGLMKKAVAVCKGVGDFDEYIVNGENGFLMNVGRPEKDAEEIIRKVIQNPELVSEFGEKLCATVRKKFSTNETTIEKYLQLINGKL